MALAAGVASACIIFLAGAAPAVAKPGLRVGFADELLRSGNAEERRLWLDRSQDAGAGIVRVFVRWREIASRKPNNPSNPADPAYSFAPIDAAVRDATARGMEVLFTTLQAPAWAEGGGRPQKAPPGTWKPKPKALGDFAETLARRYSGSFPDPANPGRQLPRVRYFQDWNEPNLDEYLSPQWKRRAPVAARHYARMLKASGRAIKSVRKDNVVVTAGLAPYGDNPGSSRTRPLRFWREVFCLGGRKALRDRRCPSRARFDIFGMHAINTSGPPRRSAVHPDDASTADLDQLQRTLRAAERAKNVLPGMRHPLWVTEFWWESNPPDSAQGYPLKLHARFIAETMYLSWKAGASAAIYLQIRDSKYSHQTRFSRNSTGAYSFDGKAKPAVRAFQFPFVADQGKSKKIRVWGKAPVAGKVRIEFRRSGGWEKVGTEKAGNSRIFQGRYKSKGATSVRAVAARKASLPWRLGQ